MLICSHAYGIDNIHTHIHTYTYIYIYSVCVWGGGGGVIIYVLNMIYISKNKYNTQHAC